MAFLNDHLYIHFTFCMFCQLFTSFATIIFISTWELESKRVVIKSSYLRRRLGNFSLMKNKISNIHMYRKMYDLYSIIKGYIYMSFEFFFLEVTIELLRRFEHVQFEFTRLRSYWSDIYFSSFRLKSLWVE